VRRVASKSLTEPQVTLKGCHSELVLRGISCLEGSMILLYALRAGRFLAEFILSSAEGRTPLGMTPAVDTSRCFPS
jgi:hypothetical protein